MKKPIIGMLSLLAGGVAIGQVPLLPPIPIVEILAPSAALPTSAAQRLIGWRNGAITCDGAVLEPLSLQRPAGSIGYVSRVNNALKPVTINFAVDTNGRPHAIKRNSTVFVPFGDDLEPVLATAQFKRGAPHARCQVTYEAIADDFSAAPIDALIDYSVFPGGVRLPKAGYARVAPADSTCFDPEPAVRNRVYPDFQAIPQVPGARHWSMIGFDIDGQGRPIKLRVFRSTGNAALDKAATKAIAESRFAPGARRGCLYPHWKAATPLPAPSTPDDLPPNANATCPVSEAWKVKPVLRFPETYRRRGVEGWAVIGYDVAPWGATGNVRVIASEPSEQIGAAALNVVRLATKESSPQGYVNCVTRVRFVMADQTKPAPAAAGEPPAPF